MSNCFNLFKLFREYLFFSLALIPTCLLAQQIDIVIHTTYTVAGNGVNNPGGSNNGYVTNPWTNSWADFTTGSSENTIVIHSSVSNPAVYGGLNYPFSTSPVNKGDTNVVLKDSIEASSNTVIIYNNINNIVFGGYSVFSAALSKISLRNNNIINSTFSFCNNTIEISSFSNISSIYGAYLSVIGSSTPPVTLELDSSIYLDNNYILFNSSSNVSSCIYAAYLNIGNTNNKNQYNLKYISVSNNTIEIKDYIINCPEIFAAQVSGEGSSDIINVENLYITNNKIILSKDDLDLPDADLYAFSNLNKVKAQNQFISDNTLQINNAKNIKVKSIHNFDAFSFNLPNNLSDMETILTLKDQSVDVNVDANKLSISNYDTGAYSSPLTLNLIDSYGSGSGNITISNSNGSYLYDNTRTQLKVIDKTLIFYFNPTIAPSPVDPVDPSPAPSPDIDDPLPDTVTLDPQTIVISQAGAANISFVCQGLDLIMDEGIFSAKNQTARTKASFVDYDLPFFSTKGLSPFAVFSASKNKFFSSSSNDIDVNGFSIIAGLVKDSSICDHNLTLGLFFEHGNSKFETSNFFDYDPTDDFTVAGKGNSHYNGAGFLARLDFINNIYLDASARLGNAFSDYFSSDLTKLSYFSFDYSTTYYGAHAGLGYLLTLNDALALDLSSKYFFTNLAGKDVPLPENQSVSFDTESVQKVKIGAKLQINDNGIVNAYFGGGFEYEPYNKIEATIRQLPVDTPELGGGRGIIEAGFNSSYKNLSVDLSSKYSDGNAGNSISGLLKFSYMI